MQKAFVLGLLILTSIAHSKNTKDTLNVSFPSKIASLDPVDSWSFYQQIAMRLTYDTLTDINIDGEVVSDLAKSWSVSPDLTTYVFHLKEAKFHDSSPLTAHDVAFSVSRHFYPESKSRFKSLLGKAFGKDAPFDKDRTLKALKVIDDKTLQIRLPKPYIPFISLLSLTALSIVKKGQPELGTGPYKASINPKDNNVILSKNDEYHKPKSTWKKIIIRQGFTEKEVLNSFKNDLVDISIGSHLNDIVDDESYDLSPLNVLSYNHLLFNPGKTGQLPKEKRQTLGNWIKSIAWTKKSMGKYFSPAYNLLPQGILPPQPSKSTSRKQSLATDQMIKKLFKQPLQLIMVERHFTRHFRETISEKIKTEKLPINLKFIQGPEYMNYLQKGNYDVISYPFITGFYDPDGYYIDMNNYAMGRKIDKTTKELNSRIELARHVPDKNKRLREYGKIFDDIQDYALLIPIYNTSLTVFSRANFQVPPTSFRNNFDLSEVKIESK